MKLPTQFLVGTCLILSYPGAASATLWQNGDVITYSQGTWNTDPAASGLVTSHYTALYPAGLFEVGIPGAGGFSMLFTDAVDLLKYIPTSGTIGALDADLINPT